VTTGIPISISRDEIYSLPSSIKPFMLGAEYAVGGVCPEVSDFRIFAKFLKDNPEARGNIVVRERALGRAEGGGASAGAGVRGEWDRAVAASGFYGDAGGERT
jgi:hypothetical protein